MSHRCAKTTSNCKKLSQFPCARSLGQRCPKSVCFFDHGKQSRPAMPHFIDRSSDYHRIGTNENCLQPQEIYTVRKTTPILTRSTESGVMNCIFLEFASAMSAHELYKRDLTNSLKKMFARCHQRSVDDIALTRVEGETPTALLDYQFIHHHLLRNSNDRSFCRDLHNPPYASTISPVSGVRWSLRPSILFST